MDVNDDEITDKNLLRLIPVPVIGVDDPFDLANYAAFIMKNRWPEAEPLIKQDPPAAAIYAIYITKCRCYNLEYDIFTDYRDIAERYYDFFRDDFKREEEDNIEFRNRVEARYREFYN